MVFIGSFLINQIQIIHEDKNIENFVSVPNSKYKLASFLIFFMCQTWAISDILLKKGPEYVKIVAPYTMF